MVGVLSALPDHLGRESLLLPVGGLRRRGCRLRAAAEPAGADHSRRRRAGGPARRLGGAFIYLVLSIPITLLMAPMERVMMERIIESGSMPPEFREYAGTYMGGAIQLAVGFFLHAGGRLDVGGARRRARVR